jgi:hypothetical protein
MKRYKTTRSIKIEIIEIERETEKQIVLKNGTRESKISECGRYYDTFETAREFLLKREYDRRDAAVKALKQHEQNIIAINEMKEDK